MLNFAHFLINAICLFMLISNTVGLSVSFLGPINHPIIVRFRCNYLPAPANRAAAIWMTYVIPVVYLIPTYLGYRYDQPIVWVSLLLSTAVWIIRMIQMARYPARVYHERKRTLAVSRDGSLTLIDQ